MSDAATESNFIRSNGVFTAVSKLINDCRVMLNPHILSHKQIYLAIYRFHGNLVVVESSLL